MQTELAKDLLETETGQTADRILRSCVHCGFCLSTCPTYAVLGDELDSPRGRIYLIKSLLEGNPAGQSTHQHLDRCLTCLNCETTCPSGVEYGHLLDIGRTLAEQQIKRPQANRLARFIVRKSLTTPWLFNSLVALMPFLRHSKAVQLSEEQALQHELINREDAIKNSVILLSGCVQPSLAPNINQATVRVLNKLGLNVIESEQKNCCGAMDEHLCASEDALIKIKRNIDDWLPYLQQGCQAIISNTSGCGVMLKDYVHLLRNDDEYADKARIISDASVDIAEFLAKQDLSAFTHYKNQRVTYHSPCTLQHGQKLPGLVEDTLRRLGYRVSLPKDAHLCCGSAGTYSILQPKLAKQLRANKIEQLEDTKPPIIVTANIGCLMHLQKATKTPVKHWIELL